MKEYFELEKAARLVGQYSEKCAEEIYSIANALKVELVLEYLSTEEGTYSTKQLGLRKAVYGDIGICIDPWELPKGHWAYTRLKIIKK